MKNMERPVARLNFFPYYEPYLSSRTKKTTFRLNKPRVAPGDLIELTVGWEELKSEALHEAQVIEVYSKRLEQLADRDFDGESPDCRSREAAQLVLSAIYRRVVSARDEIWIIKFL